MLECPQSYMFPYIHDLLLLLIPNLLLLTNSPAHTTLLATHYNCYLPHLSPINPALLTIVTYKPYTIVKHTTK